MRTVLLLGSLVSVVVTVAEADVPPSQASPLSQVLSKLEQQGLTRMVLSSPKMFQVVLLRKWSLRACLGFCISG
ncbi:hypothetical protein CA11_19480 [Gimesia maris]|nr:hypothetical protein CA11_19480 [Gimesia maris]